MKETNMEESTNNTEDPRLQDLKSLFKARDRLHQEATKRIIDCLGPTVVEAIYSIFEVEAKNVTWIEIQPIEESLAVLIAVTYDEGNEPPAFVLRIAPSSGQEGPSMYRLMRVSLPLDTVFASKDYIIEFLKSQAKIVDEIDEATKVDDSVPLDKREDQPHQKYMFDPSALSEKQLEAARLFRYTTTNSKH